MLRTLAGILRYWPRATRAAIVKLPFSELRAFLAAYQHSANGSKGVSRIRLRDDAQPVAIRHSTSDFAVFCQVLLEEQYRCIPHLGGVRTIIDAGANIGCSTRYLLRRFSDARVIAIEPDSGNIETARENLSHLSSRCELLHGALWSRTGCVSVVKGTFRDGREWAAQVEDASHTNGGDVEAFTVADVVNRFSLEAIDILKIDIEGAERQVFSGNTDFMRHVRCCAIELHDASTARLFHDICRRYGFTWTTQGEITVALRGEDSQLASRAIESLR